jgi:hypothetical protein
MAYTSHPLGYNSPAASFRNLKINCLPPPTHWVKLPTSTLILIPWFVTSFYLLPPLNYKSLRISVMSYLPCVPGTIQNETHEFSANLCGSNNTSKNSSYLSWVINVSNLLHALFHWIPSSPLCDWYYYHFHFTKEESKQSMGRLFCGLCKGWRPLSYVRT